MRSEEIVLNASSWVSKLRTSNDDAIMPDTELVVGKDNVYKLHRAVLASASTFFKNFFAELDPISQCMIKAPLSSMDILADDFELIIDAIYCQKLTLDDSNAFRLHTAASKLGIDHLAARIVKFIAAGVTKENVFDVWCHARIGLLGSEKLEEACAKLVCENFETMCTAADTVALPFDSFSTVFKREVMGNERENLFLIGILKWIHHDWKDRFPHVKKLLAFVDWNLADNRCCKEDIVNKIRHLKIESETEQAAHGLLASRLLSLKDPSPSAELANDDKPKYLYLIDDCVDQLTLGRFDIERKIWEPFRGVLNLPEPDPISQIYGLIKHQSDVYVICSDTTTPGEVYARKTRHNSLLPVRKLRLELTKAAKGFIKVAGFSQGGVSWLCVYFENENVIDSIILYDLNQINPDTKSLEPHICLASIGQTRKSLITHSALLVSKNKIVIIGGVDGNLTVPDVKAFVIEDETWVSGLPLSYAVGQPYAILDGDMIHVFGFQNIKTRYDGRQTLVVHLSEQHINVKDAFDDKNGYSDWSWSSPFVVEPFDSFRLFKSLRSFLICGEIVSFWQTTYENYDKNIMIQRWSKSWCDKPTSFFSRWTDPHLSFAKLDPAFAVVV